MKPNLPNGYRLNQSKHLKSVFDCSIFRKPVNKSTKRRIINLSEDEDEDEDGENEEGSNEKSNAPLRRVSLSPPPIVGQEALRQAMAVIQEHAPTNQPTTRPQTSNID